MEDVLDLYAEAPDPKRPVVCFDESPIQLAGALYQTFPACEARRVLRRLEFHYVPKHASWLNMVEIEIGVLARQCLDRRIESRTKLAVWEKQRGGDLRCVGGLTNKAGG